MQGTYRIFSAPHDLIESFVAAPGPAGWRYFGRFRRADVEQEVMAIDYVVDAQWDLVRFRAMLGGGDQVVAVPQRGGLEVVVSRREAEAAESVPGATAVWSSSPCSLLLADRRLRSTGERSFKAVSLAPPFQPDVVQVRLEPRGAKRVNTPGGASVVEDVDLFLDDRRVKTLIRSDLPLFAEGWFELIG